MRRLCFLLLVFLFPLQLLAGTMEPMAKEHGVSMQAAIALCGGCDAQSMSDPAASSMNDQENGIDQSQAQSSDLEDQILPAPLATVPLDWHPFPHLHIYVNDASSVLVALLRPPPSDNV